MNLGPKKDGSPNVEFFQSPESLQGFEAIRLWLQKSAKKVSGRKMSPSLHLSIILIDFLFISSLKVCAN
jgi:SWI/SNF related-matrix-associated actin-dependent regulator of chromatin subfamily C